MRLLTLMASGGCMADAIASAAAAKEDKQHASSVCILSGVDCMRRYIQTDESIFSSHSQLALCAGATPAAAAAAACCTTILWVSIACTPQGHNVSSSPAAALAVEIWEREREKKVPVIHTT